MKRMREAVEKLTDAMAANVDAGEKLKLAEAALRDAVEVRDATRTAFNEAGLAVENASSAWAYAYSQRDQPDDE